MTSVIYFALCAGGIIFLAGAIVRAVGYARQPIHLRWEIYPVPQGHGGQLKVMVPEILFLKGLWEFNRSLWYVSYPFHLGLYVTTAAVALSVLDVALARWVGSVGMALVLAGSIGLLARRLTMPALRIYTTAGDIFNLVWFAVTAILLLAGWQWPSLGRAGLVSGAALIAYIPMTHMAHFVAKFFTYHQVRWDERSSQSLQSKMAEYLTYRPTWSAPHIGADGERTWAEIATTAPKGGNK